MLVEARSAAKGQSGPNRPLPQAQAHAHRTIAPGSNRRSATSTSALALPARADLHQQHGFVHAGAVTTLLDTACGFAALSVMDDGVGVGEVGRDVALMTATTAAVRGHPDVVD